MFPLPLQITTRPSPWAFGLLLTAHGLAGLALALADLHADLQVVGGALLAASAVIYWRFRAELRLRCSVDGEMEIWREGTWSRVEILPDGVVLPWLVALSWRERGRIRHFMIPLDALAAEDHRRLRVWLKWRARDREATASVESAS